MPDSRLPDRIRSRYRVDPATGCWTWIGKWTTGNGYGKAYWRGAHMVAHRVVWLILRGHICPMLLLDHQCRNRACGNPDHLTPNYNVVNTDRGLGKKTQFGIHDDIRIERAD